VRESVTQNELNALQPTSQSTTDLHQTCHDGNVLGDVITYCFWCRYGILMSIKPEVELIFTIAIMENMMFHG